MAERQLVRVLKIALNSLLPGVSVNVENEISRRGEMGYKPNFSADDHFTIEELQSSTQSEEGRSALSSLKDGIGKAVMRPKRVQVEKELEQLSRVMDTYFRIPVLGWRFGLNLIIDLIPG